MTSNQANPNLIIGCVAENTPKYLSQALRLLQSVRWFGGSIANAEFRVCAIEGIDPSFRKKLESYGATVCIVPRYEVKIPVANKIRFLQQDDIFAYDTVLLLDCDTIVVQDLGSYLTGKVFRAKIADGPTMPHDLFKVLFNRFGMPLPRQDYLCTAWGNPTIAYFNTGVLVFPGAALLTLVPKWIEFTDKLINQIEILAGREHFCEQASMSLALAASGEKFKTFGNEMNFPTHFEQSEESPLLQNIDPLIIHYHSCYDADGYINGSRYPLADARIAMFNDRLRQENLSASVTVDSKLHQEEATEVSGVIREAVMHIPAQKALAIARENKFARKYPSKSDARFKDGILLPVISPRFHIPDNSTVFTIGSCFARNIEEKLAGRYNLPTMSFYVPKSEFQFRSNGLLNEYNPGTMYQRIVWALSGQTFGEELIIEEGGGYGDLLLPAGDPVARERVVERRREIDAVYKALIRSDVVIITLGLIESWYDNHSKLYLNRMPPEKLIHADSGRFEFHILGVDESFSMLDAAIAKLISSGIKRILLTVSPVPIMTTFSGLDCMTANNYSKSVLRVCADKLYRAHPEVDYFPSYEMIVSKGHEAYIDDNIHVSDDVVGVVTQYMIDNYVEQKI